MTPEQLRQNGLAMIALSEGKPIQFLHIDGWRDTEGIEGIGACVSYRPKPEPVSRRWSKPEDVPGPVCWIRDRLNPEKGMMLISNIYPYEISTTWGTTQYSTMESYEHSTDRKTWSPCVVTEEAK